MNKTQFKHLENLTDVGLEDISLDVAISYVKELRSMLFKENYKINESIEREERLTTKLKEKESKLNFLSKLTGYQEIYNPTDGNYCEYWIIEGQLYLVYNTNGEAEIFVGSPATEYNPHNDCRIIPANGSSSKEMKDGAFAKRLNISFDKNNNPGLQY